MVDIHCHILPSIDDGSKSWEMSAEMCRVAVQDGVKHIVATPHCNDEFPYDRERYTEMLSQLSKVAEGKLSFSMGCDFHFSYDNIQDAIINPRRYTIGDSHYLLIEFSDYGISPNVLQNIFQICSAGLIPIITHPERNMVLQKHPERVLDLIERGCLVQVTANAITGFWGGRPRKIGEWLLKRGAVHFIASDAHDPKRRNPVLSEARNAAAEIIGPELANALVEDNPEAVISGKPIPYHAMYS